MKNLLVAQRVGVGVVLLCLAFAPSSARGEVVLSNLGGEFDDCQTGTAGFERAEQFTTAADGPYVLNSVTFSLLDADESDTFTTTLNADGGSAPGAVLATIGSAEFGGSMTYTDFTLIPASEIILASNTTYWLVSAVLSPSCVLKLSVDLPTGEFTFDTSLYSGNSGATWSNDELASIFAIDASPQEVPSLGGVAAMALALLLAGAGLLTFRRRAA